MDNGTLYVKHEDALAALRLVEVKIHEALNDELGAKIGAKVEAAFSAQNELITDLNECIAAQNECIAVLKLELEKSIEIRDKLISYFREYPEKVEFVHDLLVKKTPEAIARLEQWQADREAENG